MNKKDVIHAIFLGKIFVKNFCPCKLCSKFHACSLSATCMCIFLAFVLMYLYVLLGLCFNLFLYIFQYSCIMWRFSSIFTCPCNFTYTVVGKCSAVQSIPIIPHGCTSSILELCLNVTFQILSNLFTSKIRVLGDRL